MTGFVERALAFFAEQTITPKRLMTDNAWAYTNNGSLRELLDQRHIRQLRTRPYRTTKNRKGKRMPADPPPPSSPV